MTCLKYVNSLKNKKGNDESKIDNKNKIVRFELQTYWKTINKLIGFSLYVKWAIVTDVSTFWLSES